MELGARAKPSTLFLVPVRATEKAFLCTEIVCPHVNNTSIAYRSSHGPGDLSTDKLCLVDNTSPQPTGNIIPILHMGKLRLRGSAQGCTVRKHRAESDSAAI